MSWIPPPIDQQRWNPRDETESGLVIANQNVLLPGITDRLSTVVDFSQNVSFGRKPYTFRFLAHNFPAGVILEPRGLLRVLDDAQFELGGHYSAVVEVRDANNQVTTFAARTSFVGTGPLLIGGDPIPPAHTGVPFYWRPIISGGVSPYRTRVHGLNFPELGFKVSDTTGEIVGAYNGSIGNVPGNLIGIRVWNRNDGRPDGYPSSDFDAELATTWDLLDP